MPAPVLPGLTRDEILRYSRHLLIPEVGLEGQRKLKGASALVIGTGGSGIARLPVPGRSRNRPHWTGGLRRGGCVEPAAAGDPRH